MRTYGHVPVACAAPALPAAWPTGRTAADGLWEQGQRVDTVRSGRPASKRMVGLCLRSERTPY
jgi:hypothetical protein